MSQKQSTPYGHTHTQESLPTELAGCNQAFAVIERSLTSFLEAKKLAFPRFYFLSNDELLEVRMPPGTCKRGRVLGNV